MVMNGNRVEILFKLYEKEHLDLRCIDILCTETKIRDVVSKLENI